MTTQYFKRHVFFCTNDRGAGAERPSCNRCGSQRMRDYAKKRIKALELNGEGKVRVNNAGCLDRCELGPVLVIYPQGVWYTYVDRDDLDEIIEQHLQQGKVVERLRLSDS